MRVLIDGTVFEKPAAGIAKATLGLYEACLRLEPSMDVLVLHRRPLQIDLPHGMRPLRMGPWLSPRWWRRLAVPSCVLRYRPTFAHFPNNGSIPRLIPHTMTVATIHDVLPLTIPGYFKSDAAQAKYVRNTQRDLNRADLVLTDSNYSKQDISRRFRPKAEPVVIYLACRPPADGEMPESGEKAMGSYFIYVGGYDRRKGLEELLEVFSRLWKKRQISSKLVLVGAKNAVSTRFEQMIDDAVRLGLAEELGYISDKGLWRLLSGAKALVYPSAFEGFGLPPLEAMTVGCPVITTRNCSIPEVCGDAAYYVDPSNEEAFATAIVKIENDNRLRADMAAKSKERARGFSWEASARRFLDEVESRRRGAGLR